MRTVQELSVAQLRRRCETKKGNVDDEMAELDRRGYDWFFTTVVDKKHGGYKNKMVFIKGPGVKFTLDDLTDDLLCRLPRSQRVEVENFVRKTLGEKESIHEGR